MYFKFQKYKLMFLFSHLKKVRSLYKKMNQLQNLLHDALIATSHVEKAALLNKDDYSIKAASVGFILQDQDVENFIDAFQNPAMVNGNLIILKYV